MDFAEPTILRNEPNTAACFPLVMPGLDQARPGHPIGSPRGERGCADFAEPTILQNEPNPAGVAPAGYGASRHTMVSRAVRSSSSSGVGTV
jgi:hypothetical protein